MFNSSATTVVKTVSGRHIAQAGRTKYPPQERANDAAGWMVGAVKVRPTAKLACETFRISYPLLQQAQERLGQHSKRRHGGTALSDSVVERFIARAGIERVWRVMEKLTRPQLPLQAAE